MHKSTNGNLPDVPEAGESNSAPVIIDVQGLTHTYPNGVVALKNVSLQIHAGEFVAFIGQNGSGKTTVTKHFVGLLRPTTGKVYVYGQDTAKAKITDLARKVGYVFQNADDQIFCSSVEEEVVYGLKNIKLPKDEIQEALHRSLAALGIEHLRKLHPLSLSWGDRQKVAIASVLAIGPEILILDEPTTGQDLRGGYEILETCQRLHEQGKTIIIVTHQMELVAEFCQRAYLMYQGEILTQGNVEELFADEVTLRKSHIVAPQITRFSVAMRQYAPNMPFCLTVARALTALRPALAG